MGNEKRFNVYMIFVFAILNTQDKMTNIS